jgi:microsomal dipeptidase-like Zn-dependent dipeptidase
MPNWFEDNRHFGNIEAGLIARGFSATETAAIMGENWLRFYDNNFGSLRV